MKRILTISILTILFASCGGASNPATPVTPTPEPAKGNELLIYYNGMYWVMGAIIRDDSQVVVPGKFNDGIHGEKVLGISQTAFQNQKNLKSIKIDGARIEGGYARLLFQGCDNLEHVEVTSYNLASYDGVMYSSDYSSVLYVPPKKSGIITFKKESSLSSLDLTHCNDITGFAFEDNESTRGYRIEDGVIYGEDEYIAAVSPTRTGSLFVKNVSTYSFTGCRNISEYQVDSDNNTLHVENGVLYSNFGVDTYRLMRCPNTFEGKFEVPSNTDSVMMQAFLGCNKITEFSTTSYLMDIGQYAFKDCTMLSKLSFGDKVTSFEQYAFYNCPQLTSVSCELESIRYDSFYKCDNLTSINLGANYKFTNNGKVITLGDNYVNYIFPNIGEELHLGAGEQRFIDEKMVSEYKSIKRFTVDPDNTNFYEKDGVLYWKETNDLYRVPAGKEGTLNLGKATKSVDINFFEGCNKITSIVYDGTKEEFQKITGIIYITQYNHITVYCSDGTLENIVMDAK